VEPLGRPRRRWEDNIRMDFKEIVINTRNCRLPQSINKLETEKLELPVSTVDYFLLYS
jgi:hypothetical protein